MSSPRRSPFSLIQEDLYPNRWAIVVSCIMLNCTRRAQVVKILPSFLERWPTAIDLRTANLDDVVALVRPLGFANRRAKNLKALADAWSDDLDTVEGLPGCGEYAIRSYNIFVKDDLGSTPPSDGALYRYWAWASQLKLIHSCV